MCTIRFNLDPRDLDFSPSELIFLARLVAIINNICTKFGADS